MSDWCPSRSSRKLGVATLEFQVEVSKFYSRTGIYLNSLVSMLEAGEGSEFSRFYLFVSSLVVARTWKLTYHLSHILSASSSRFFCPDVLPSAKASSMLALRGEHTLTEMGTFSAVCGRRQHRSAQIFPVASFESGQIGHLAGDELDNYTE